MLKGFGCIKQSGISWEGFEKLTFGKDSEDFR